MLQQMIWPLDAHFSSERRFRQGHASSARPLKNACKAGAMAVMTAQAMTQSVAWTALANSHDTAVSQYVATGVGPGVARGGLGRASARS